MLPQDLTSIQILWLLSLLTRRRAMPMPRLHLIIPLLQPLVVPLWHNFLHHVCPHLCPEPMNPRMTHSFTQVSRVPNRNPIWNGSRGSPHYNFPLHPSSGVSYRSPGFEISGRLLYNSGQHITHQPRHSPNLSPRYSRSPGLGPGRGRGGWYKARNGGSGWGGGQRLSSHGRFSDEDKPRDVDQLYKKSMVEDPWQLLKPNI